MTPVVEMSDEMRLIIEGGIETTWGEIKHQFVKPEPVPLVEAVKLLMRTRTVTDSTVEIPYSTYEVLRRALAYECQN